MTDDFGEHRGSVHEAAHAVVARYFGMSVTPGHDDVHPRFASTLHGALCDDSKERLEGIDP